MSQREEFPGPPERVMVMCPYCRRMVATFWAPMGGGLLPGQYSLWADEVLHDECAKAYFRDLTP